MQTSRAHTTARTTRTGCRHRARETDARHSDYCDAAVVSRQVVTRTWTRSIHHLKSVCTQATEADVIRVVPRFAEEQHVDGEVTANVKQVVELVGQ